MLGKMKKKSNDKSNEDPVDKNVYEKQWMIVKKIQYMINDVVRKNMSAMTQR